MVVHSISGWTRGVQVKLWDPLGTRAIPERLRGMFTTRRYTNTRLPLPLPLQGLTWSVVCLVVQVVMLVLQCSVSEAPAQTLPLRWSHVPFPSASVPRALPWTRPVDPDPACHWAFLWQAPPVSLICIHHCRTSLDRIHCRWRSFLLLRPLSHRPSHRQVNITCA